jgi:hypothetical protein
VTWSWLAPMLISLVTSLGLAELLKLLLMRRAQRKQDERVLRTLDDLRPGDIAWTTNHALGVSPNGVPWLRRNQPVALEPTLPMRVVYDRTGFHVWPVMGHSSDPCRKERGWLPVAVVHDPVVPTDPVAALTDEDQAWLRAHGWDGQDKR